MIRYLVGRRLVRYYLPERAAQWSAKVDNHRYFHTEMYLIEIAHGKLFPFLREIEYEL